MEFLIITDGLRSLPPYGLKSLVPHHISFEPIGKRTGKEKLIFFLFWLDRLPFPFPLSPIFRPELRYMPLVKEAENYGLY